jgi:hypothetical protein
MAESDMHYNQVFTQEDMTDTATTTTTTTTTTTDTITDTVSDNNYGLTTPLPEEGEYGPAYPGNTVGADNTTNRPNGSNGNNRPGTGAGTGDNRPGSSIGNTSGTNRPNQPTYTPVYPVYPAYPIYPNYPSNPSASYGQVRFLNASTNSFTVDISIDGSAYVTGSGFASLSDYDWISDGFHTVTIRNASGLRSILLQQTFPFTAGQKVTMVLTDAASGGLELIRVIDTGCTNLPSNSGCFRFANMTYSGSNLDLMLGNQTVFRNISYQSVSDYKQSVAGSYQFTAVNASAYSYIRELPVIIISSSGTSLTGQDAILTFNVNITAGKNYTSYLIGNTWSNANLRVITTED